MTDKIELPSNGWAVGIIRKIGDREKHLHLFVSDEDCSNKDVCLELENKMKFVYKLIKEWEVEYLKKE